MTFGLQPVKMDDDGELVGSQCPQPWPDECPWEPAAAAGML